MAHESQNIDSIYDFLYIDHDRLKSWLAQMFSDGVLTTHKTTSQSGESSVTEITVNGEIGGQASALIAKGSFKGSAGGKLGAQESALIGQERSFDASWSLPLNVLDSLDEHDFIHRDISAAPLGSVILASGTPQLIDISLMREIWGPAGKFLAGNEKVTHKNKQAVHAARELYATLGDILKAMPPAPQMHLLDNAGAKIWASLKEEYMIVNTSSLALNHGVSVKGTWHVLAVLDALPDIEEEEAPGDPLIESQLMQASASLLGSIRELMGRSATSYGVTPVLIFRNVAKR